MRILIPILLCAVLTGCAKPRCLVTVANIRDDAVPMAVVRDNAGNTYKFKNLAKESRAQYLEAKDHLGRKVPLEITDKSGKVSKKTVKLDRFVTKDNECRVVFQLEKDGKIRPFVLPPTSGSSESDLSWTRPEDWEGAPSIPGMSGGDR